MNSPVPHFALREWRAHMAHPTRAVALIGVAAILALIGPFDTAEVMRPLPRAAYWLVLVGASYSAGYIANGLADRTAPDSTAWRIAIAGPLTGLLVLAIVYLLNGFALGYWAQGQSLGLLAANVMAIAVIVSAIFQLAHATVPPQATTRHPPTLLERLPLDKRAPLVALSVEDHYVRIRTTKGEEMILMRLADAIRETAATPGLQVHRSHWVAFDQVVAVRRKGDGALLQMSHGPDVPVSRANLPKLREAGLLPR